MLSKLMAELKSTVKPTPPDPAPPVRKRKANKPIQTTYASVPIPLPDSFLTTLPPDAQPITVTPIDFATSPLPEYANCYAVVLDNVLSPSECATLLSLAEASVPPDGGEVLRNGPDDPWGPALVNVGGGFEVLEQGYRNGERIVWDRQEVVDRLWQRCLSGAGQGLAERFAELGDGEKGITGSVRGEGDKWVFVRVNERMRFLKYGKGGFFRPHCDAPYFEDKDDSKHVRTMFTIHLYLNDSQAEVEGAELVGGATTFYSSDEKRKIDVNPKAGRVLIFQHRRLYHSGEDVLAGTKYTMRTDILYELVRGE
ncbi:uncharacterized protein B0T15DRAFT_92194 [Chaetomium strumarium]|uniref:Prolyl 4-hydroxylase alpha subunit domain-containing protein n=1 Tax=Chaetomium strumarium TaxID=1170767 RepID=A0AAJ0M3T4_9PEZI|nr:hypothetical protein B0T15DRAFT_92194 [Chaetomium strumarium]